MHGARSCARWSNCEHRHRHRPDARRVRVERLVTSGTFTLDGGSGRSTTTCGSSATTPVASSSTAPDPDAILAAIGGRELTHILCTHAHNDHIDGAPGVAQPARRSTCTRPTACCGLTFPDTAPDADLGKTGNGFRWVTSNSRCVIRPGTRPARSACMPRRSASSSAATPFQWRAGATGRSFSDYPTIVFSIREQLLTLPPDDRPHRPR